jgi:hypothetical protein
MYNNIQLIKRIDELIEKGNKVLATHRENPQGVIGFTTLDHGVFTEWRSQTLSLLTNFLGGEHVYVEDFKGNVEEAYRNAVRAGQGILRALSEDIQGGYLQNLESLISANIFTDFLEMASHLIEEGYKDAAAVLIGGTLEEHLRRLCLKSSIDVEITTTAGVKPKKADQMNAELSKANVYTKLDQKNVTAWLDLRNKAAHGEYGKYTNDQVALFLSSIRDFITRIPA